ncbi:MAG: response regulator transcription factor [Myxococcaceae bacterium]
MVEDDARIGKTVEQGLSAEGHVVTWSQTGEDAFFQASSERFELILLDLMLPGRSGLEILRTLRKKQEAIPVLILTARDGLEDRVEGLDSGADDYLVKPFAFPELLARIRALVRRGQRIETHETASATLSAADLQMSLLTRKVERAGKPLELTQREFALLEYLLRNQGHVVSREMLARDVWQETQRATSIDNVIDVHIARLRKKVDTDQSTRLIQTVRGLGFIIREEPA